MIIFNSIFLCTKPVEYMIYVGSDAAPANINGVECYQHIHAWSIWQRIYIASWIWWKLVWRTHGAGAKP